MILAPRYIPRLVAMVNLFTRYGLRDFASQQGLQALAPDEFDEQIKSGDPDSDDVVARAAAFRARLVELGPAYVKLGQVLSTRPDLLPRSYILELEKLQDDVAPLLFTEIEFVIEEELGGRISKLFAEFDHEPLGSASLGQVHAATLRDGRSVVVKVQRPNIRADLADDLEFFGELARFLTAHTRAGARIDLVGVIEQLERALTDELDYRTEARNAATLRRSLAEFPHILVPRIIEAYTTSRVLTMERVKGIKVDSIPQITRVEHDFHPLADEFAKAYLKQITIDGHFHADPHPGNIFLVLAGRDNPRTPSEVAATERRDVQREAVTPLSTIEQEAQKDAPPPAGADEPRLALIDFGMTARLSKTMQGQIVNFLLDIAENHGDEVGETLIEMGEPLDTFNRSSFVRETASLVARNHDRTVGEVEAGTVLYELINIAFREGLRLPAELTLLAKALFNMDSVTRALDPGYSPIGAVKEYGNTILNQRAKDQLSPRRLFQIATKTTDLMSDLPHRLDVISHRLATNDFAFRVDAPQLTVVMSGMQKIANRIFTGLVLAAIIVASAMVLPYHRVMGTGGFVVAALAAAWMVVSILISDRRTGHG